MIQQILSQNAIIKTLSPKDATNRRNQDFAGGRGLKMEEFCNVI